MPASDRVRELIQKSLEAIASDSELAELDRLLATEPKVADALAAAARLHASLTRHFGKQQKLDQVARLLDHGSPGLTPPSQRGADGHDSDKLASGDTSDFDISAIDLCQFDPGHIDPAVATAGPSISSYVARDSKTIRLFPAVD